MILAPILHLHLLTHLYLHPLMSVNLMCKHKKRVFTCLIGNSSSAKCTVIVRLLNFITALWMKYPQDTKRAIDNSFYSPDLTKLILTCVLNPTQLGFDINNEEINRKLPERVCVFTKKIHVYCFFFRFLVC